MKMELPAPGYTTDKCSSYENKARHAIAMSTCCFIIDSTVEVEYTAGSILLYDRLKAMTDGLEIEREGQV